MPNKEFYVMQSEQDSECHVYLRRVRLTAQARWQWPGSRGQRIAWAADHTISGSATGPTAQDSPAACLSGTHGPLGQWQQPSLHPSCGAERDAVPAATGLSNLMKMMGNTRTFSTGFTSFILKCAKSFPARFLLERQRAAWNAPAQGRRHHCAVGAQVLFGGVWHVGHLGPGVGHAAGAVHRAHRARPGEPWLAPPGRRPHWPARQALAC